MPKVALTELQETKKRLKNNLNVIKGNRTDEDMGAICGISGTTFSRRRSDPFSLTAQEVYLMCQESHVAMADFYGKTLGFIIGA